MSYDPQNSIDLVRAHFGIYRAIAEAVGLKNWQAVQQWKEIPAQYVLALCEKSGWALTPHQLRPDLYPYPQDALPKSARQAA